MSESINVSANTQSAVELSMTEEELSEKKESARKSKLANYLEMLEEPDNIAISFNGVTKSFSSHLQKSAGLKNYMFNFFSGKGNREQTATVLNNLTFNIPRGSTVGFIGRNGAGKSTLLSLIAQVIKPNSGEITVNGHVSSLLELGAGFHPELTGRENIELFGVVLGFTRQRIKELESVIIAYSELGEKIDVPVRFYSSGMLARLGFSVAAQLDPDILLVDEVLAVGDFKFKEKSSKLMESFHNSDKTIIIVSHSAGDIERLCDYVFWIENGEIKSSGDPVSMLKDYHSSK